MTTGRAAGRQGGRADDRGANGRGRGGRAGRGGEMVARMLAVGGGAAAGP